MITVDTLGSLLAPAYSHGEDFLAEQCARYAEAIRLFQETYGQGPVRIYRAPGRVNLIGEHTDYNQGFVMPTAIDRDVVVVGRPRTDSVVRARNVEERYREFEFECGTSIAPGPVGDWSNYVRGAAQRLAQETGGPLQGMDMVVSGRQPHGTPIGVGLSSSTSLTVVATLALSDANEMGLDGQRLAELAAQAEWYTGTRGGIMDQFASVLGRGGHALFLDCRPIAPGRYRLERIPLPEGYRVVVCNTGVRHENTRSEFNTRVFECRVGAHLLSRRFPQVRYLRDVSAETLGMTPSEIEAVVDEALPPAVSGRDLIDQGIVAAVAGDMPTTFRVDPTRLYRVRQRCRHVVTENQRVLDSMEALKAKDVTWFGHLMEAAHESVRDNYEVSIPEVEAMLEAAHSSPGCIGARLTGAGWGGCVVAMVRESEVQDFAVSVAERYHRATSIRPDVFICNSATGAQVIARDEAFQLPTLTR